MKNFTMQEIISETGLTADTLRYYEKEGMISGIHRKPNGHRVYTNSDLEWLKFAICLRKTGMSVKNIKEYRKLMDEGDKTISIRKEMLKNQREKILEEIEVLKEGINRLDFKLEYYQSIESNL